jgi:hypothetical protein
MKHSLHRIGRLVPVVALIGALHGSPVLAQADQAPAWAPAASVPALQARMKSIREATDPERRMALMEEQIKALEAASQGAPAGCPMMGGQMMGGSMGAGPMMKGRAPGAGPAAGTGSMGPVAPTGGMMMDPKLMEEHMKMMQEHMGMMQNMMKMPRTSP